MNLIIVKYKVVYDLCKGFEGQVNKLIQEGWQPLGGYFIGANGSIGGQVMVKYGQTDKNEKGE